MLTVADVAIDEAEAPAAPATPVAGKKHHQKPVVLDEAECRAILARVGWGVIATVGDGGAPYAVPIGYALGRDCVYVASGAGQKTAFMQRDRRVCLTVSEVATFGCWRSVVVQGEAIPVEGFAARTVAMAAFAAQRAPRARASTADARRFANAYIVRIPLAGMSGRGRGEA